MKIAIYLLFIGLGTLYADDLAIVSVSPKNEISDISDAFDILVTFNQPMVPFQATPTETENKILKIEPPVSGKSRWLGTRTFAFTPTDTLPYATAFNVTIIESIQSIHGDKLEQPYTWEFITPTPKLISSQPSAHSQQVQLDTQLLLRFNQPMSPERVHGKIKLESEKPISFKITIPKQKTIDNIWPAIKSRAKILELIPDQKLDPSTTFRVILENGLLGAEGSMGMDSTRIIQFQTHGDLHYLGYEQRRKNSDKIIPNHGIALKFSNPVKPSELVTKVQFSPKVTIPDYYSYRNWGDDRVFLSVDFRPNTKYKISLSADLTDVYGYQLNKTVIDSFVTADHPPGIDMTTGLGIVEAYSDRNYPVYTMNQDSIRLRMGVLTSDEIIPLLTRKNTFIYSSNKPLPHTLFSYQKYWQLSAPKNTKSVHPIKLDWVMGNQQYGQTFVEVNDQTPKPHFYRALLQVTDMAISAKLSPQNNVIWVTSLKDVSPVPNASVQVRDDNNNVLWTGFTDSTGLVVTPGWKELGIRKEQTWDKPRQWIFVTKGQDFTFVSPEQGMGIQPYRFDIAYEWNPEPVKITGRVFTDRGLYQPGETVNLKGILREKIYDKWRIPENKKLDLKIRTPRGDVIREESLRVSEFGSFDTTFDLDKTADLGYYWVSVETLKVVDNQKSPVALFGDGFQVQSFRPAKFEVKVNLGHEQYVLGDSVAAFIHAQYLFGAPMTDQDLFYRMYVYKTRFTPPGYSGFQFGPLAWGPIDTEKILENVIASGEGTLDKQGNFTIENVIKAPDVDFALELVASADVEGADRQHIGSADRAIVHPARFYIGTRLKTHFIRANKTLDYEMLCVNPDGTVSLDKDITVKVYKRQWNSVRKAGLGGRYQWISQKVDSVVDSMVVKSKAVPLTLQYTPNSGGLYFIRAEAIDKNGNKTATDAYFYVSGQGYVAWERSDDDRIELVADKESYKPGETATVMIKSPYERADALITIEREGIISQKTMTLKTNTPTIEIPILDDHLPNIFVSVMLLKGRVSKVQLDEKQDVGRPSFKIGYINLPVDANQKRLTVSVKTGETYQPGERIDVYLDVENHQADPVAAEVTLAIVDEGVLNLIDYQLPDLFDQFYGLRPLSVNTLETRLNLIEQRHFGEKGENRGGGGADAISMADYRRDFKPTVYWNPAIRLDSSGQTKVTIKAPDNLSRYKIMAVAHSKNSTFGYNQTVFKTQKPLMLQTALPRFMRLKDQFDAGVIVHNYTGKRGAVYITGQVKGIQNLEPIEQKVNIANGETREIRFPFKVELSDTALFRFRCNMAEYSDAIEIKIPVKLSREKETVALYDRVEESSVEKLEVPQNVFEDLSHLDLFVASTAMTQLEQSIQFLFDYPYECLEQKTSRLLPAIMFKDLIETFGLSDLDLQRIVENGLVEIKKCQQQDGGFSLWPDGRSSWPYVSVYATFMLTKAKQMGYEIDRYILNQALDYLRNVLTERVNRSAFPYNRQSWLTTDAFILYVLTLNNRYDPGYAEQFYAQRDEMTAEARAFLLKAIHMNNRDDTRVLTLVNEFVNKVRVNPTTVYFEDMNINSMDWIFYSTVRSTAIAMDALLQVGHDFPFYEQIVSWFMQKRQNGHWQNTQENFYVLQALNAYFIKYESNEPDFSANIAIGDQTVVKRTFSGFSREVEKVKMPFSNLTAKALDVNVNKSGTGSLYYGMRMTYYPTEPVIPREQGITLLKTVLPVDSDRNQIRLGDLVKIELKVVLNKQSHYLVVSDPLAAGLEPVNLSLSGTQYTIPGQSLQQDWSGFSHVEMRMDRVVLFANQLDPGIHTYTYYARAITPGAFMMPSTYSEQMYTPEVYGRTKDRIIEIR